MSRRAALAALAACLALGVPAAQAPSSTPPEASAWPIFDAHLHYNDEAFEPWPPEQVLAILRRNRVRTILANSRPNAGSERLARAAADSAPQLAIVPFIRVYRDRTDYGTWFRNPEIVAMIEHEFKHGVFAGQVRGIGEFHLYGEQASAAEFAQIVAFAKRHGLWLHAHCDETALLTLFRLDPQAKVIWAHTGFSVPTSRVAELMRKHRHLMGELSYRNDITEDGQLTPAWRALLTEHADRFLLGSDTWINSRWAQYDQIMAYYRSWLAQLPPEIARQIAYENGERVFGRPIIRLSR
ncbi:MAG: amidohydrolase [Casimicrobiaceae bacterium]|nr:amidohydrolase [Casimicrobiaceae bacterium]